MLPLQKNLWLLLVLFAAFPGTFAQEGEGDYTPEEMFHEGEFFFQAEEYEEALYFYESLLRIYPGNANYNYKAGITCLEIPGREHEAIPYLEKAVENTKVKYRKRSFKEDHAPFHAHFYLGKACRINDELDKALTVYNQFRDSDEFEGNYNVRIVEEEIRSCERAKIIKDSPINIRKTNPGHPVNSSMPDYNAVVSGDGTTMVFIRELKFYDGIFLSGKSGGRWSEPENLNPQVGSDGDMYPTGLSHDGTELFLVKRNRLNDNLYHSIREGRFWSKARELNNNINSLSDETHASISSDGEQLYFTSGKLGGEGGLDIYVSNLDEKGEWGEAYNLGPKINTEKDEETPFLTSDGKTLYFSSTGHYNMGGYDIFYSNKLPGNGWTDAVNAGYPVNTTRDNLFFVPLENGERAVMSLRNQEDAVGGSDIYFLEIFGYEEPEINTGTRFRHSFEILLINTEIQDTTRVIYKQDLDTLMTEPEKNRRIIYRASPTLDQ